MWKQSVSQDRSRLWRPCNGLERAFCTLHHDHAGSGHIAFLAHFSGPFDAVDIEYALRHVAADCPRATMLIQRLDSGDFEFRIPYIPAAPPIEFASIKDFDEGYLFAAELEHQHCGLPSEPVLRWVVLSTANRDGFQIVTLAHHALFDARSLVILLRRFLETLGRSAPPPWQWPEQKLRRSTWSTFAEFALHEVKHSLRHTWIDWRRKRTSMPDSLPRGMWCVHRWSAAETTRLTDACRSAQTTITAALGITGAMAFRTTSSENPPIIDIFIPIDMRRYLPRELAEYTLGMASIGRKFAVDFHESTGLALRARALTSRLHEFVAFEGPLRLFELVNWLLPKRVKFRSKPSASVFANSLGRLLTPDSPSGIRMVECGWFAKGTVSMPAVNLSAATIDGALTITTYSSCLSSERFRAFATTNDQLLRHFAGLPDSVSKADEQSRISSPKIPISL